MNMMNIEEVVGDIILIILEGHESLQKIGIETDKIFAAETDGGREDITLKRVYCCHAFAASTDFPYDCG